MTKGRTTTFDEPIEEMSETEKLKAQNSLTEARAETNMKMKNLSH